MSCRLVRHVLAVLLAAAPVTAGHPCQAVARCEEEAVEVRCGGAVVQSFRGVQHGQEVDHSCQAATRAQAARHSFPGVHHIQAAQRCPQVGSCLPTPFEPQAASRAQAERHSFPGVHRIQAAQRCPEVGSWLPTPCERICRGQNSTTARLMRYVAHIQRRVEPLACNLKRRLTWHLVEKKCHEARHAGQAKHCAHSSGHPDKAVDNATSSAHAPSGGL